MRRNKKIFNEKRRKHHGEQSDPRPTKPRARHHCAEEEEQKWIGKESLQSEGQSEGAQHKKTSTRISRPRGQPSNFRSHSYPSASGGMPLTPCNGLAESDRRH